jgi:hypothetical protein
MNQISLNRIWTYDQSFNTTGSTAGIKSYICRTCQSGCFGSGSFSLFSAELVAGWVFVFNYLWFCNVWVFFCKVFILPEKTTPCYCLILIRCCFLCLIENELLQLLLITLCWLTALSCRERKREEKGPLVKKHQPLDQQKKYT